MCGFSPGMERITGKDIVMGKDKRMEIRSGIKKIIVCQFTREFLSKQSSKHHAKGTCIELGRWHADFHHFDPDNSANVFMLNKDIEDERFDESINRSKNTFLRNSDTATNPSFIFNVLMQVSVFDLVMFVWSNILLKKPLEKREREKV
ncbi:unnamed protein product [Callosobruchus maculatus]|uniref:Uncharacterized protein n=1 Tax=Callosobruchus maculatus TaxID=64391 RepID=A0A653DPC2_CALMS|nr:unnamed protein product [Callosobruchus maculatus]